MGDGVAQELELGRLLAIGDELSSRMTRMRVHSPISSGSSDDTTSRPLPAFERSVIRR